VVAVLHGAQHRKDSKLWFCIDSIRTIKKRKPQNITETPTQKAEILETPNIDKQSGLSKRLFQQSLNISQVG
jgi:hypothetical protein